jgi:hypothetical protein
MITPTRTIRSLSLILLLLLAGLHGRAQDRPNYGQNDREVLLKALHAVPEDSITHWMHTLIAPGMRGRLAGDIGYDRAAHWAAGKLSAWGLQPFFGHQGFFQVFDQPYTLIRDTGSLSLLVPMNGEDLLRKDYQYALDYWPWGVSGSGQVKGEVVYAGYGITAPELGYDDFAGVDVAGKIVLCELGIPYAGTDPDILTRWQPYREVQYKIQNAIRHGARGMLFAYHVAGPRPTVDPGFVFLAVADHVVEDFFSGTGRDRKALREGINRDLQPASFPTGKLAEMSLTIEHYPDGKTSNVVAMIEGKHPELKQEYLVVGAHLDHLGMMPVLFPGALDNASGVAIALGVAKAISQAGIQLDRSVVILLFGAEEVGLVGATWFVEHFPYPTDRIKMMINLDMVGRGNALFAATSDPWAALLPYFERNNELWVHRPMMTRSGPWAYSFRPRTDGAVFSNFRIPTIHFGARGASGRSLYHVPEDDMRQIEVEIMRDVVKLLTMTLTDLANEPVIFSGAD